MVDGQSASSVPEHVDVLIVGAGISGIGAARHLQQECPDRTFAILEGREQIGGTWDLFRYPGIRSDSDMYTLGYTFKPWTNAKAIADGPAILDYLEETVRENGIDRHIRFQHHVDRASWSSADARWTVTATRKDTSVADDGVADDGAQIQITCSFLYMCSGYYSYAEGHRPTFPGEERYAGELVHPQFWPDDLDYAGKRIVVIGSGATAVTLVPAMAETAGHVTMLQRSPSYVVARPEKDSIANALRRFLPEGVAYRLNRWKNVLLNLWFYRLCRRKPEKVKEMLRDEAQKALGEDFDVETHFKPSYDPWDQRMCLVPDGDLFEALKAGTASVVTDQIETFTESGIRLRSGRELEADIVVTATGLKLQLLSGLEVTVDGERRDLAQTFSYKGAMFSGIPNLALSMGYTNASWTLKADLIAGYVCRLLNHMERHGYDISRPREADPQMPSQPFLNLTSGYVRRSMDRFPKQGTEKPWRLYQNYLLDFLALRFGRLEDGVLQFEKATRRRPEETRPDLVQVA